MRNTLRLSQLLNKEKRNIEDATAEAPPSAPQGDQHLSRAKESLASLLNEPNIPRAVKAELATEYETLQAMLDKLEHGHIHIAVFGRVSVGKSSLLNALIGENRFYTSALHGATRHAEMGLWEQSNDGHVYLCDTPGINEIDGEEREKLAHEVAARSDLVLYVVDGDITETEIKALHILAAENRPLLLILNKSDRYTKDERELLMGQLRKHTEGLVQPQNIVQCTAAPTERIYVEVDQQGNEREVRRQPPADVDSLRDRLWKILESEGKTLAAINAGIFAGRLSDQVAHRITELKQEVARKIINNYCLAKGLAVAFNPVPITDIVAAAALDISLIIHLSRIYGLPITSREAGSVIGVIMTQMAALMGAVWAMNLISSLLKLGSVGLSTVLTASAQGSVAYYGTLVVGRTAERYFAQGKSWGELGPKRVVKEILASIDRASVLKQARADIGSRLSRSSS